MAASQLPQYRRILGVDFFNGDAAAAVDRMKQGGLLVVPSAPALKDLPTNRNYRDALIHADFVIADSGFMVLIWNLIAKDSLRKLSGLEYLRILLKTDEVRARGATFWVMASRASAEKNLAWLDRQGFGVDPADVYIAPLYGAEVKDEPLLERVRARRPRHIIVTVGGGTQEPLGLYIKRNLDYLPAIHCIGAAIAFLSGDQVKIPAWADRIYLAWLWRCLSQPKRYFPRYWNARKLLPLMLKYRDRMPAFES